MPSNGVVFIFFLPCLWEDMVTLWTYLTPPSRGIQDVVSQIYQKALSLRVMMCLLTFFRNGRACVGPYRTKSKCRQVVNPDINCHLHRLISCSSMRRLRDLLAPILPFPSNAFLMQLPLVCQAFPVHKFTFEGSKSSPVTALRYSDNVSIVNLKEVSL